MRGKITITLLLALFSVTGCNRLLSTGSTQTGKETQSISPLEPLPGDVNMIRGEVSISSSELLLMESYPLQVSLKIQGTLPTPCHKLRVVVNDPDPENKISVEAFSLVEPDKNCIQVLELFEESIPLGSYPDGTYSVILNGEEIGKFIQ